MSALPPEVKELESGVFVYLQPDGSWGLSNSGLILGTADKLLVDTFFDLNHTRRLLDGLERIAKVDPAQSIVVNTHANGDHCYGNSLVSGKRIIASESTRLEMLEMPAKKLNLLMKAAGVVNNLGASRKALKAIFRSFGLSVAADLIDAAPYVLSGFRDFDFSRIPTVLPTETFSSSLELELGERTIKFLELGPAHTKGDVIAFDVKSRTLFAGDLLFIGAHPLAWSGTPASCIASLEKLLELDPRVVVPGHGALTDANGIRDHIEYFRSLREETRPLFETKVDAERATKALMERGFGARAEPERLYVNVAAAYREFAGSAEPLHPISAMAAMSRLSGAA